MKSHVIVNRPFLLFTIIAVGSCLPGFARSAPPSLEELEEQAVQQAVAQVAKSVVRIETLGGLERVNGQLAAAGPTTGLCVSQDGYIISSAFNFIRQPASILVTLPDGKRASAKIIARDQHRMLVLLKVDTDIALPVPKVAPRSEWAVGQWSIAVGRAYSADAPNVSVGILSATHRIWDRAVQTDAKVSPGNYGGPLIDIRGRVIGVLVPLSPQQTGELAGAEWYDSGIGFAVPLEDILRRLDDLKGGKDLYRGLLGISFKGSDIYSQSATIAACPAKSPAYEAGLRVGDKIVEIEGRLIERRAQLQHALGPLYAGDRVRVTVERGPSSQRFETTVKLAAKIDPYVRPFLGILPARTQSAQEGQGVQIRFVFPDSPASNAQLKPNDQLVSVAGKPVVNATELREAIARLNPNQETSIQLRRDGQDVSVKAKLVRVPNLVPAALPKPSDNVDKPNPGDVQTGVIDIALPEESNRCRAYIPTHYDPNHLHGLLVWLPAPGADRSDDAFNRWKTQCDRHGFILLEPQPKDPRRWQATEVEFVQKTIDNVLSRFSIDAARVAIGGHGVSGTMAYLVAFANRDVIRGIASIEGTLPQRIQAPTTDPLQPLSVYSVLFAGSSKAKRILGGEELMTKLAFPITSRELPGDPRQLSSKEYDELVRWFDILDRI